MNITLLGTSHISKESVQEIKTAIEKDTPDIVAVELDIQRATSLLQNQKNRVSVKHILQIGVKGYLFAKIGQIVQQKMGKMVGMTPGSEMKTALLEARKRKLIVALIDQPIGITLKKFSKALTWKERGRFIADIFKGLFFPRRQMKEMGLETIDLSKVPKKEFITKMMKNLKDRYPSLYQTLVEDRNKYMVKKLVQIFKKEPDKKVLAIVGAGHVEGMQKLLNKIDIVKS